MELHPTRIDLPEEPRRELIGLLNTVLADTLDLYTQTKLGDAETADLYTDASRSVDKHLWFLEAHLQA